jgi:hypothetical protein
VVVCWPRLGAPERSCAAVFAATSAPSHAIPTAFGTTMKRTLFASSVGVVTSQEECKRQSVWCVSAIEPGLLDEERLSGEQGERDEVRVVGDEFCDRVVNAPCASPVVVEHDEGPRQH